MLSIYSLRHKENYWEVVIVTKPTNA